jgi:hypothetical protein
MLELAERTKQFKVHFASAREAFNIAQAAIDGTAAIPAITAITS